MIPPLFSNMTELFKPAGDCKDGIENILDNDAFVKKGVDQEASICGREEEEEELECWRHV